MSKGFINIAVIAIAGFIIGSLALIGSVTKKPDAIFGSGGKVVSGGITSLGGLTGTTQTFTAGNGLTVISSSGTDHNFQASTSPGFGRINASSTITFNSLSDGVLTVSAGVVSGSSTVGTNLMTDAYLFNTGDTGTGIYDFSGASSFKIPNAAAPTVDETGETAIDNTSGQFKWFTTGPGTQLVTGTTSPSFPLASTTLNHLGIGYGKGTTSILMKNDPEAFTLVGFYCKATSTLSSSVSGFVRFGDAAGNFTTEGICNTTGVFTLTPTNNTWTRFEDFIVEASSTGGTAAGTALQRMTITTTINKTSD